MARRTQKYLAAVNQARALAIRNASAMANDTLYERLEGQGYWWKSDAGRWTNEPRPRSRRIEMDGSGANPDLLEFRVTAQGDRLPYISQALRKMADVLGWTFVQQSEGYENRNQDGLQEANKRVRVYLSFIMPSDPLATEASARGGVYIDDEGEIRYGDEG